MKKSKRRVARQILALLDSDYLPADGDRLEVNELALMAVHGVLLEAEPNTAELEKLAKAYLAKNRLPLDGEGAWKALVAFAQGLQ